MQFLKAALLRPVSIAWGGIVTAIALAGYFGLDSHASLLVRVLLITTGCFGLLAAGFLIIAINLYGEIRTPIQIRKVVEGTHFYQGTLILIMGRSHWATHGQLLLLTVVSDEISSPLALIKVIGHTTSGFPQCVMVQALTTERLDQYLSDPTRLPSLAALSDIQCSYLERLFND